MSHDLAAVAKWRRKMQWKQPISITPAQGMSLLFFTAIIFTMLGAALQNVMDGMLNK